MLHEIKSRDKYCPFSWTLCTPKPTPHSSILLPCLVHPLVHPLLCCMCPSPLSSCVPCWGHFCIRLYIQGHGGVLWHLLLLMPWHLRRTSTGVCSAQQSQSGPRYASSQTMAAKSHLKGQERCSQLTLSPHAMDLLCLLDCLLKAVSKAKVSPEFLK